VPPHPAVSHPLTAVTCHLEARAIDDDVLDLFEFLPATG
jgi:hypothetical protein